MKRSEPAGVADEEPRLRELLRAFAMEGAAVGWRRATNAHAVRLRVNDKRQSNPLRPF
jgi:hypothetical protein